MSDPEVTTKEKGTVHERVETRHPSFGVISLNHTTGSQRLFGSAVSHQHYMVLSISKAYHSRDPGISQDWLFEESGVPLIEVAMSHNQLAELLFNTNIGVGVPCTIKSCRTGKLEETWREGEPPEVESTKQYLDEFEERMKNIAAALDRAEKLAEKAVGADSVNKTQRKEILNEINSAKMRLSNGMPFILQQFTEKMEQVTQQAKAEIEATFSRKMNQLGVETVKENPGEAMKLLGFSPKGGGER